MGRRHVAIITCLWTIPVSILVDSIVPSPYMDEIFHIRQAQEYCRGNFKTWDPMITTPPGLYLLSLVHAVLFFPLYHGKTESPPGGGICGGAPALRSVNAVLAILCSVLFHDIIIHLRPSMGSTRASVHAVVLSLYPLHWFFTFLYYTDVASLTAVLAMYLSCLKKRFRAAAIAGAASVLIRQTNVIWVVFVACDGVIDATIGRRRQHDANEQTRSGEFLRLIDVAWLRKRDILFLFSPLLLVVALFLLFLYCNGGIVLGAKEAHTASPHLMQMLYFGAVTCAATFPLHVEPAHLKSVIRSSFRAPPWLPLSAVAAALLTIRYFSVGHPYLLADNRHYTFYLWRRVINFHWSIKYGLAPFYIYSWLSIASLLRKERRAIWSLCYFLACAAVLVPAPLIEFRYYTVPFYIFVLHAVAAHGHRLHCRCLLVGLAYAAVNLVTLAVFLFRPFRSTHDDHLPPQRFLW